MTAESHQPVPLGPTESLASLLWNLHHYYSQFSDCVQARVAQLRQPIEKELKVGVGRPAAMCKITTPVFGGGFNTAWSGKSL